ncbi:MAG: 1-acyl-sn-glycerol-3-phosphate acyltransferase [Treponema sp.]|nr:1-acyl-sn-glycerol-3-phosphate acyltransferase [Treponema sp.]
MMVGTLNTFFHDQIKRAISTANVPGVITEDNVFQEGNPDILPILDEMVETLALEGSGLEGLENLEDLYEKAESGKSCLLLSEHYSNLDLSIVSLMTRKAGGRGNEIGNAFIAIAGMKLNEDNRAIAAFAGAYSRIVIYPSRTLQDLDPEKDKAEILRGNAINRAAMKAIIRNKYNGKLILVFPSGTRYRPWAPESKKGVRDIDAYIRSFDYMCFIALNGQIMGVQKSNMINDAVYKDMVRVTVSPVHSCNEFRNKVISLADENEDKKQAVADAIMNELEKMHVTTEEKRLPST